MKKQNAMELNEQFKDCPTESHEYEIEGRKYIVVSHFKVQKTSMMWCSEMPMHRR